MTEQALIPLESINAVVTLIAQGKVPAVSIRY